MITFTSGVMKVGNSIVLVLPKPLVESYGIEKGDTLSLGVTDKGIYIPLSPKKEADKQTKALMKEVEKS